jgi:hypothetical protein
MKAFIVLITTPDGWNGTNVKDAVNAGIHELRYFQSHLNGETTVHVQEAELPLPKEMQ